MGGTSGLQRESKALNTIITLLIDAGSAAQCHATLKCSSYRVIIKATFL